MNELKFGFNRSTVFTTNQGLTNLPYSVAVAGLTTLANNELNLGVGNSFSYIDNLTLARGPHTLKFGVEVRRIQLDQGNTANGTIVYSSLNLPTSSFLVNAVSSATFNQQLPVNGMRKTAVYTYAQDEWKPRPNLTLNLGVRYSFYNIFHEAHGKANPFDFATCGAAGFCGVGASFGNPNTLDIDPRIGVCLVACRSRSRQNGDSLRIWALPRRWPTRRPECAHQERGGRLLAQHQVNPRACLPHNALSQRLWHDIRECGRPRPQRHVRHPMGTLRSARAFPRSGRHALVRRKQRQFRTDHVVRQPHRSGYRRSPQSRIRPGEMAGQFEQQLLRWLHRQSSAQLYPWFAGLHQLHLFPPDRPGCTWRWGLGQSAESSLHGV